MKNAMLGLFSFFIILLAGFAINTSEGKTIRKNELTTTLSASMEKSMEILTMTKDYSIADQKEFVADFIQNAMIKMNSDSKYNVKIYSVDVTKGILDAEVTETYRQFLKPGKVSIRKTIVLDDYSNPNNRYFTVTFKDQVGTLKQISIHGGDSLSISMLPEECKNQTFKCEQTGTTHKGDQFKNIMVVKDLTFMLNNPTYILHYDGNGATNGNMADENFSYGVTKATSANKYTKAGYEFKGWTSYIIKNGKKHYRYSEDGKSGGNFYMDGAAPSNYKKVVYPDKVSFQHQSSGFSDVYIEAQWEEKGFVTVYSERKEWSGANSNLSARPEYVQTDIDLSPIIEKHNLIGNEMVIEFDFYTEKNPYTSFVYTQNGNGTEYSIHQPFTSTTAWKHYKFVCKPTKQSSTETRSMLSFYTEYGTGCNPHIKNIEIRVKEDLIK